MLITAFLQFRPEGHREPRNEVGFLIPAGRLVESEPGIFRFSLQRFNPLGHSPIWIQSSRINWYVKFETSKLRQPIQYFRKAIK